MSCILIAAACLVLWEVAAAFAPPTSGSSWIEAVCDAEAILLWANADRVGAGGQDGWRLSSEPVLRDFGRRTL